MNWTWEDTEHAQQFHSYIGIDQELSGHFL